MKQKSIRFLLFALCCLCLTSCAGNEGRWLIMGVDLKTEMGLRPDPVDSFSRCLKVEKKMSRAKFTKLFVKEASRVKKNPAIADWGKLGCLGFHPSASVSQVKRAAALLPDKGLPSEERLVVDLLRVLLKRRAVELAGSRKCWIRLQKKRVQVKQLEEQVKKLQEIELLLQKGN